MIKYKREQLLSATGDRTVVIWGVLCGCLAIDLLRVELAKVEEMSINNFTIPAIIFAALSVFLLLRGIIKASTYRKKAIQSKNNYMQNGVLSQGKVTDAGGGFYQKAHYSVGHVKRERPRYFRTWESVWWADIEYYDEIKGIYARRRVLGLNKNGKLHGLIGKEVDIYHLDQSVYVNFK